MYHRAMKATELPAGFGLVKSYSCGKGECSDKSCDKCPPTAAAEDGEDSLEEYCDTGEIYKDEDQEQKVCHAARIGKEKEKSTAQSSSSQMANLIPIDTDKEDAAMTGNKGYKSRTVAVENLISDKADKIFTYGNYRRRTY